MPDAKYSTIVVHKGPSAKIHGQSHGPVYVLRLGDSSMQVGRMTSKGTVYSTARPTSKFEKLNGTNEIEIDKASDNDYTIILMNSTL